MLLEATVAADVPEALLADAGRLRQILDNLLGNDYLAKPIRGEKLRTMLVKWLPGAGA